MKRGPNYILLSFAVSFLLPLSCAYSCYDIISEADFLTRGIKFEAGDTEDLLADKQSVTALIPTPLYSLHFLRENFFEPFSEFSLPIFTIHQTPSALRC